MAVYSSGTASASLVSCVPSERLPPLPLLILADRGEDFLPRPLLWSGGNLGKAVLFCVMPEMVTTVVGRITWFGFFGGSVRCCNLVITDVFFEHEFFQVLHAFVGETVLLLRFCA